MKVGKVFLYVIEKALMYRRNIAELLAQTQFWFVYLLFFLKIKWIVFFLSIIRTIRVQRTELYIFSSINPIYIVCCPIININTYYTII